MNKKMLFLTLIVFMTVACNLSVLPSISPTHEQPEVTVSPTETGIEVLAGTIVPAIETPIETRTAPEPSFDGAPVFFQSVSLILPRGLASGISGSQIPRMDGPELPYWELTPGHTVIKLEGYLLQGKFFEPQIYIYPAPAYAELFPGAFESMHRLRNVMGDPSLSSIDILPAVPFFNATQIFTSNMQPATFQNGSGVRFVTEYAHSGASVNNHHTIYQFQGFTDDGEYYVIAIFPITVQVLAETNDPDAVLPPGGVAQPEINAPAPDYQTYYAAVTDLLNATPPESFMPMISQLDRLIQSMNVIQ